MCNNTSFTVLQVNIATNINLYKKISFLRTVQQHKNSNNQALFLGKNPQVLLSMVINEARGKQKLKFLIHNDICLMTSYHRKNSSQGGALHFRFMSHFTVPQPTVGHCFRDIYFHPMLATMLFILQPEDHRQHRQEVGTRSFTESLTNWATVPKDLETCERSYCAINKNF